MPVVSVSITVWIWLAALSVEGGRVLVGWWSGWRLPRLTDMRRGPPLSGRAYCAASVAARLLGGCHGLGPVTQKRVPQPEDRGTDRV